MEGRGGLAAILIAVAPTSAHASEEKPTKAERIAMTLTPEHFAQSAEVRDDALEVTATITTQPGFQDKKGLLKIVWEDNFLRAFIDKKSGKVFFQVYQTIAYTGQGWRQYRTVNMETQDGPQAATLTRLGSDVSCAGSRYGACTYLETVGFDVDEALLRSVAAKYQPNVASAWRFRFKAQSGDDWTDGILPAEVAGMLSAVDRYKASHRLAK